MIEDQEILSFNMMAMIDGYYVAMERTALYNASNKDILMLEDVNLGADYETAQYKTAGLGAQIQQQIVNTLSVSEDPSTVNLKETMRIWRVVCRVLEVGRDMLVPGAVCGDVAKALNKIFEEAGLLQYRTFGYGHSFGVLSHYYGEHRC